MAAKLAGGWLIGFGGVFAVGRDNQRSPKPWASCSFLRVGGGVSEQAGVVLVIGVSGVLLTWLSWWSGLEPSTKQRMRLREHQTLGHSHAAVLVFVWFI